MNDELLLVEKWIEMKRYNEGRSAWTCRGYTQHLHRLKAYLEPQGQTLLTAQPETIEEFCGKHLHDLKIRPISRRVPVSAIRGFYGWLKQRGILDTNPAQYLPAPKAGRPLPKAPSLAQAETLLMQPGTTTFIGLRDTAMISVLIGSGCRVSGLVNLTDEDLIWTQNPNGTERLIIRFTEKGKKERLVPMPFESGLMIHAYLGHPELEEINRVLPNGRRVLFVSTHNPTVRSHDYHSEARRLSCQGVHNILIQHGAACGIPKEYCHPHALRHLYGTELAESEVDLLFRQALLGHARPDTTEIYTHLAMRKLSEVVDKASPIPKLHTTPVRDLAIRLGRLTSPLSNPPRLKG